VNVHAGFTRRVGHVKEGLEAIEEAVESVQLSILFEVWLYLIEIIS
jgi:hypothetical protein